MTDDKIKFDVKKNLSQLQAKLARCREILRGLGSVVVGLSGGVDSSLLLALAVDTLGAEKVLAVTVTGFMHSANETASARLTAGQIGAELVEVDISEFDDEQLQPIRRNQPDRCYWCKFLIFEQLAGIARQRGLAAVVSGSNADDSAESRPGSKAERQLDVAAPLLSAGMTKQNIRDLAQAMSLKMWDKPANPCLATRLPYGRELSEEVLRRIEVGEAMLAKLGFEQYRLRDHDTVARLEVSAGEIPRAVEKRAQIVAGLKALGYTYVTLDLEGFRSGAMDETLFEK